MQGSLRGNAGPRYRHRADEGAPYETMAIDKLTPIIGAEISGIDLAKPLSNRQQDEIATRKRSKVGRSGWRINHATFASRRRAPIVPSHPNGRRRTSWS